MKRRIYGVELEVGTMPYEFMCSDGGTINKSNVCLIFKHAPMSRAMREYESGAENNFCNTSVISDGGSHLWNAYLLNEARFYCDTNWHMEYATPETRRARDCVRWEKAGERVFEMIAEAINREEPAAERWRHLGGITFLKNNTDPDALDTWGSHENFLVERRVDIADIGEVLIPFLSSSHIWNGSGKVVVCSDGEKPSLGFILSQRMHFMRTCMGPGATSDRAMVNTRDEPLADKEKWRRLEILSNDSHMSEVVSYLDYSLTGLILEMVEVGFLKSRSHDCSLPIAGLGMAWLRFKDDVNCDLSLKKAFLIGGRHLRALDLQYMYLEVMRKYEKAEGLSPEQKDAVGRFESLLGKIEGALLNEEPEKILMDICDWAAKRAIIKRDARVHRYSIHDIPEKNVEFEKGDKTFASTLKERMVFLDLAFHDMRRNHGLHYALLAKGLRQRMLSEEEISSAIYSPPADTRAAWRKWWQDKAEAEALEICSWNWTNIRASLRAGYQGPAKRGFIRNSADPFESDPEFNS